MKAGMTLALPLKQGKMDARGKPRSLPSGLSKGIGIWVTNAPNRQLYLSILNLGLSFLIIHGYIARHSSISVGGGWLCPADPPSGSPQALIYRQGKTTF